ncbi:Flp family type IVb pilin [Vibrio breoganii]|nr:Flp family type IVb pilin [Vibrio breoganii]
MDINKSIVNFFKDEEGLTVVEYVIGAAMLVGGLTLVFNTLGTQLSGKLSEVVGEISTTNNG